MDHIQITVPDGSSGLWRVETFEVSKRDSDFTKLREAIGHPGAYCPPGTYKRLVCGYALIMSNTLFEVMEHRWIISKARGRVLINGLGLGMCLKAILAKPEVEHVTVIEKSADVIKLVGPTYACPRLTIIWADAFTYQPKRGEHFDVAWHDIWSDICSDHLPEMRRLFRKYARRVTEQNCWGYYATLDRALHP